MARYSNMTPEGTSDLIFKECQARRAVEERVKMVFRSLGYSEVVTPELEFYDVFANEFRPLPQEMMYKFIDARGRILVLRPDNTMPIARLVSTKLRSFAPPLRLYYDQTVYRVSPTMTGRRDEVPQCGVELIGVGGMRADLEVVATAVETLRSAAAIDFRLELGHVGFYKAIIDGLPFESQKTEEIRGFIETKNYAALQDALAPYVEQNPSCRALLALPRLFGGEEVFERARAVAPNEQALSTLDYLQQLYDGLCGLGLKDSIILDLGLVNQIQYYTGVVFRGFMEGSGETMLTGGRYDTLLSAFGPGRPAIGFAVKTDSIARALRELPPVPAPTLLFYESGCAKAAFEYRAKALAGQNAPVEMSVFDTLDETLRYASRKGIRKVVVIGETVREIAVVQGGVDE